MCLEALSIQGGPERLGDRRFVLHQQHDRPTRVHAAQASPPVLGRSRFVQGFAGGYRAVGGRSPTESCRPVTTPLLSPCCARIARVEMQSSGQWMWPSRNERYIEAS